MPDHAFLSLTRGDNGAMDLSKDDEESPVVEAMKKRLQDDMSDDEDMADEVIANMILAVQKRQKNN
jgi:hypothetical protein